VMQLSICVENEHIHNVLLCSFIRLFHRCKIQNSKVVLGVMHTAIIEDYECESPLNYCKPVFNEGVKDTPVMVSVK
jgi:hypothetical protein